VRQVEGVMHGARRMMRRKIQRLEIVVIVLDLRPGSNLETQPLENIEQTIEGAIDRMTAARIDRAPRQGDVDGLRVQARVEALARQHGAAFADGLFERMLGAVDLLTSLTPLFRRQLPQTLELCGERPLLAEKAHPDFVQAALALGPGDLLEGVLEQILRYRISHAQPRLD